MGDLIVLGQRLADRSRPVRSAVVPAFFFDVSCPFSYLAAERIERTLGEVEWIPAMASGLATPRSVPGLQAAAERRAAELRLPLVWPDRFPGESRAAQRAAAHAAKLGAGAQFALAATRLAFCGGFDLDDPEILAEASAAAGVPLDECFSAVNDERLDAALEATAHGLASRGVTELPAIRIGTLLFGGERRLVEAAAALGSSAALGGPLAPVG
jgi:2-hydroxychromene-2-carboxylate isomerase